MISLLKKIIKIIAFKKGWLKKIYIKLCKPNVHEYTLFLKKHGGFHSIGKECMIWPYTNIPNPQYVKIGNNVILTACTLLGHDGSIAMLNKAFNVKLDSVGKIEIHDNVFVGHGAIILPGVSIGPNAIIGAGSVVTKSVGKNTIVGGVPARPIGSVDALVEKLQKKTDQYPWGSHKKKRWGI